jgi:hypothetical protein
MRNKRSNACKRYGTIADMAYNVISIHRIDYAWKTADYQFIDNSSNHIIAFEIDGEIVIGIRGTNTDDVGDLTADVTIVFGGSGSNARFIEARRFIENLTTEYPPPYILCGHSLGGSICRYLLSVCPRLIKSIHTFNEGALDFQDFHPSNGGKYNGYFIKGDWISMTAEQHLDGVHKEVYKPNPRYSTHTIKQFLIETATDSR